MEYFYTYMLECSDGSFYIGHTDSIENRLIEHQTKKHSGYTSSRLPVKLVFLQNFQTRDEAFTIERKIKKWTRKKKLALIESNWNKVSEYAKKILNNTIFHSYPSIHHLRWHSGRADAKLFFNMIRKSNYEKSTWTRLG